LPAGNANTGAGTRKASNTSHHIPGKRRVSLDNSPPTQLPIFAADGSLGTLQHTLTAETASLSNNRAGIPSGALNFARIASNPQHPPGTRIGEDSAHESPNNALELAPLTNEQLGKRGWPLEGGTDSSGINGTSHGPHISAYAAEQAPPSPDQRLSTYEISGRHESAREPNRQATILPAGAVEESQPPGTLLEAQRLTPLTSDQRSERGRTREAGNWPTGPAGTCPHGYHTLSVAQPHFSLTESHPSAHINACDARNLSAGITSAGSGTHEVTDWTNDTLGECRSSSHNHSVPQPPLSTADQRPIAYMNARNAENLPAGITSASSGAREALDRTNNTFSECRTPFHTHPVTQRLTPSTGQRLRAYPNGRDAITSPAGITSGSFGAHESSNAQHDDRTTKNSATGVQCPSSGPPTLQTYNSTDDSPERRISAQHDDRTSENSATGVQCPSSGPANADYAQTRSHPNRPNPGARVQTTTDRSSLPVGQSRDLEDGKVVDWEPIPPSYELAAPADVFFDTPTMAQFWGYSWRERLFLCTLARNFTIQPRFCEGLEVPEWLQEGRYTTGIGPEGYITIRLPVLESLLARAIRDFPDACYRLFIPEGHTTPCVPFQGIPDAPEVVQAAMGSGPNQAHPSLSGYNVEQGGYPGQELSPLSPETSSSMDLDSEMTPLSTPASSVYELDDEPPAENYQEVVREPEEFMIPPSALFSPRRWTRDVVDSNTLDPRMALSNRNSCKVCTPHSLNGCLPQLTSFLPQTEVTPPMLERPALSVFSAQVYPNTGHPTSAMRSTQNEGPSYEAPSAATDLGMIRAVSHSTPNHQTIQLILKPKKPLPSRRTFTGHESNEAAPDASQVQRAPLNLATLDGRDAPMDESPSPTLLYLTIPSDESECGSDCSSLSSSYTILERPPLRNTSRQSYRPSAPSPLVNSYVAQPSPPTPDATRPVTPVILEEPRTFTVQGPAIKTSSLSRGYVIVQPYIQAGSEPTTRSMPSLITLSDSSSEVSDASSTSGEDFVYPTTPEPLPTISPPVAQLANLRTDDTPMRSPSPPPMQHTYVLPPATEEDPEVNFLINLLHIRLTDIIQSYKTGRRPALHIVESAPAPPYDPFTADRDDIYVEEPLRNASASPVIHQPQPRQVPSLPPVETLSTTADVPAREPLSSPPPSACSDSSSRPVTPVIHLKHDAVGWNWSHLPMEEDNDMNCFVVPYNTGHPPLEMEWPKVVPLDDNHWNRSHAELKEVREPTRTYTQSYNERRVQQAARRLHPNLEFLAKRAIGQRAVPIRSVRLREQIPEPVFRRTFSHYSSYSDLELDLSDKRPHQPSRANRWICYLSRIRTVRRQFLELFAAAEKLAESQGYIGGLQSYVYIFQNEVNEWIREHKPSSILHAHEFRYLCTLLHFLNEHQYHFLARHIHTFVHLRFRASYDLWTVLHVIMDRMEPYDGTYDFDYDGIPIFTSPYPSPNQSPPPASASA